MRECRISIVYHYGLLPFLLSEGAKLGGTKMHGMLC